MPSVILIKMRFKVTIKLYLCIVSLLYVGIYSTICSKYLYKYRLIEGDDKACIYCSLAKYIIQMPYDFVKLVGLLTHKAFRTKGASMPKNSFEKNAFKVY